MKNKLLDLLVNETISAEEYKRRNRELEQDIIEKEAAIRSYKYLYSEGDMEKIIKEYKT